MTPALKAMLLAPRPLIDLNFAGGVCRALGFADSNPAGLPGWSFTRAGAGTALDLAGNVVQFASGVPRITDRGFLVESARTNLLLNSAVLVTQSATVAAVAHVLSFTGTGTVTLSGVSTAGPLVGTGANNRVTLAFTPTAGSLTLTVSGDVRMGQLESGAFASSWIVTLGSVATRPADAAAFTVSNGASGTILASFDGPASLTGFPRAVGASTGGVAPLFVQPSVCIGTFNGASTLVRNLAITPGQALRAGVSWSPGVRLIALNGLSASQDANAIGNFTSLCIGNDAGTGEHLNGYIQRVRMLSTATSRAALSALTA